ncbi:MAG: hypothetical protein HOV97_18565 [Nonomuraea sp.]|nr:hypothetical protein [Nonomuraea sp.]
MDELLTARENLVLVGRLAGLDPRSRRTLWATIERLPAQGTTILLTTQHLEEADRPAGGRSRCGRRRGRAR